MKTYTLHLPDEEAAQVEAAAVARRQAPEEVLGEALRDAIREGILQPSPVQPKPAGQQFTDPWAKFRGKFLADTPDIFERHDFYIGEAAPDPHIEDPMIAVMRSRGHLATPSPYTAPADVDLPPYGSPEFDQMLEEVGKEASESLERSGLDINDLIER